MSAKILRQPWNNIPNSVTKLYCNYQWEVHSIIDGIPITFTATMVRQGKFNTLSLSFKGNLIETHKDFNSIKTYIRYALRSPFLYETVARANDWFPMELQLNT